jgi:cyclophilin family peptidyl-prolyl cis-trans isomerase
MRYLPASLLVLALAACGGDGSGTSPTRTTAFDANACSRVTQPASAKRTEPAPAAKLDATKTYEVVIETNCGNFTIRLDPKQSPNAAASFVALAEAGYFDNTVFHRIVPGSVIEGGDPTSTGKGGPGYTTVDTPPARASYDRGIVAMAKSAAEPPGTAGSRFFVVTAADAGLPPDYAIVGQIVAGLDVVEGIGTLGGGDDLPTYVQNTDGFPTHLVEIEQATVVTS